jgi:hypothetical protein
MIAGNIGAGKKNPQPSVWLRISIFFVTEKPQNTAMVISKKKITLKNEPSGPVLRLKG